MKNSEIEWMGMIPEKWNVISFWQSIKRMGTGLNPRDNFELTKEDEYYYVTIRNFKDGKLFLDDNCDRISKEAWEIIQERSMLKKGDILFASISKDGQAYILTEEPNNWNINESVFCIRINNEYYNEKYFYYHLTDCAYYNDLRMDATGSTFQSIKQNKLKKSRLLMPPLEEQKIIADFLDEKCLAIDSVKEKTKVSIEEYKKLKQAIITQAVTKGVRGDRPMKDSGIEWIGEIPEEWTYGRIKYNTYVKGRIGWQGLRADEFIDEGPILVTGMHFDGDKVNWDICYHISEERYEEAPEIHLKEKDLIMTKDGTIGKVAYIDQLPDRATLNSHLLIVRPTTNLYINHFMKWLIKSEVFIKYYSLKKYGSIMDSISQEQFKDFNFYCPSKEEQKEIADYLDFKTKEIDLLIEKKEQSLLKIEQYKKSLIYEYVTGKKQVNA